MHTGLALSQARMTVEELRELLRHVAPDVDPNIGDKRM